MNVRAMGLPAGWYPRSAEEVAEVLRNCERGNARAALSPHAGWFFSGRLAGAALASLDAKSDTIVVAGGHLAASSPPLFAAEDAVAMPLGLFPIDVELRDALCAKLGGAEDRAVDNTVEVLLPAVRYFFPAARLVWLRLPPRLSALAAGAVITREAARLGRTAVVVGSTDLTHYGLHYDFTPKGTGDAALAWVKASNDRRFIDALLAGNAAAALNAALEHHAACSAGAALCAMGFAGTAAPRLLDYTTSADVLRAAGETGQCDSFVGYAAMCWQ